MNTAIELHDSECLAVEIAELNRGFVLLRAYVHRTIGIPGESPGDGGYQLVRIKIDAMTIDGEIGNLPAYIYEGSLVVGTSIQDNLVPFPAKYSEVVCLKLMFSGDAQVISVSGTGMSIEPEGVFQYVESIQ